MFDVFENLSDYPAVENFDYGWISDVSSDLANDLGNYGWISDASWDLANNLGNYGWVGNLAPNIWSGLGNILNRTGEFVQKNPWAVNLGLSLASALSKNKQPSIKWTQPPMSAYDQAIYNQAMKMATEGFGGPETWKQVLNRGMEEIARRGLTPNMTSGAMRRTIADLFAGQAENWWNKTLQALGVAGGTTGQPQMYIQQPTQNWFQRFIQPYTSLMTSANIARAYNPYFKWSWI